MEGAEREHALVRLVRSNIKRASVDAFGLTRYRFASTLDLAVTPGAVERALKVLNALLTTLDSGGLKLVSSKTGEVRDLLEVDGVRFRLRLTEKVNRSDHKATREERQRAARESWYQPPRWEYAGSGFLTFWVIEVGRSWNLSWNQKESSNLQLDSAAFLGHVVAALQQLAARAKEGQEADRLRALEYERQRRLEEERRERLQREEERVKCLRAEAASWREAALLRSYSVAVASQVQEHVEASRLEEWLAWAGSVASRLDPLENGNARAWFPARAG